MEIRGVNTSATRTRHHSRSISSLKDERKRLKDKELMLQNFSMLDRLQKAKASFDVTKL